MESDDLNDHLTTYGSGGRDNESSNLMELDHPDVTNSDELASVENLDIDDVIRNRPGNRTTKIVGDDNRICGNSGLDLVTETENTLYDAVVRNSTELDDDSSPLNTKRGGTLIEENENATEIDVNVTDSLDMDGILNSSKTEAEPIIERLCQLPVGRVKSIIKSDPDVAVISAECLFLISKTSELFLQWLGKEIHTHTIQQKKKTIQKRDLDLAISEHPALEFLDGALD